MVTYKQVVFSVVLAIVSLAIGYYLNDYSTRKANQEANEDLLRMLHDKWHMRLKENQDSNG